MSGIKDDGQKPDLSLIPYSFSAEVAKSLMYGEKKYGRYNYAKGFKNTRLAAAALRHLNQYLEGADVDDDSGCLHLGNAAASIAMLLECQRLGTLEENRNLTKKE